MATEKLSATVDAELIAQVRGRVGRRGVSRFINQALAEKLQRERVLAVLDALEEEHGAPTKQQTAAAHAALAEIFDDKS